MADTADIFSRFVLPEHIDDPLWLLKRDIAAQLRKLLPLTVTPEGDLPRYQQARDTLARLVEDLGIGETFPYKTGHGNGIFYEHPEWFEDRNPVIGWASAMAPPLVLEETPASVQGHVTFSAAYEGPPSNVHGGFVAAILDQALGRVAINAKFPGMTAQLNVRYRHPTPIETELQVFGELVSQDSRKAVTRGTIQYGNIITAEAEAIFLSMAGKDANKHLSKQS